MKNLVREGRAPDRGDLPGESLLLVQETASKSP